MPLTAIITLISMAIGVLKFGTWMWDKFGSDTAKLQRIQATLEQRRIAWVEARAKQAAADAKIDAQPDKTGQDLSDDLNQTGKKL